MFYDTWDYPLDDPKTAKIKQYKRQANYYEKKEKSIENYLNQIDSKLIDIETDYHLGKYSSSTSTDNVLDYKYYDSETSMYNLSEPLIQYIKEQQNTVKKKKSEVHQLYQKYYKLVLEEEK
ncbi:MAG: hypothetical protein PHH04_03785 [Thomasclavelia sp.]|nr:hypothetical protein [Thomasclavelia sp.]